jgi:hypothetical protein
VTTQQIPTELVRPTVTTLANERIQVIQQRVLTRDNLAIERRDDRLRRTRGRERTQRHEQAIETVDAEFAKRRNVRHRRGAALARHSKRRDLAALHDTFGVADRIERKIEMTAGGRQHLLRCRLIRHMHRLDAGALEHQFSHHMATGEQCG